MHFAKPRSIVHGILFSSGLLAGLIANFWTHAGSTNPLATASSSVPMATGSATGSKLSDESSASGPSRGTTLANAKSSTTIPLTEKQLRACLEAWIAAGCPDQNFHQAYAWLHLWSKIHPEVALQFLVDAPRFSNRLSAFALPLAEMTMSDVNRVTAWLTSHLTEDDRGTVAEYIINAIVDDSPSQAAALALADDIPVQPQQFSSILSILATKNPARAVSLFTSLPPDGQSYTADDLARTWARTDREAAITWCEEQAGKPFEQNAIRGIVDEVAADNPDALPAVLDRLHASPRALETALRSVVNAAPDVALNLLTRLPSDDAANSADYLVQHLFASDPDQAIEIAHAFSGDDAPSVVHSAWLSWKRSDEKAAMAWRNSLNDPVLETAFNALDAHDRAERTPAEYLEAIESGTEVECSADTTALAVQTLASLQPEVARQWLSRRPQLTTPALAETIARNLAARDSSAGQDFLQSLDGGDIRDAALLGTIEGSLSHQDFEHISQTVAAINDPAKKSQARYRVYSAMVQQDAAAAKRWLVDQALSPETRAAFEAVQSCSEDFVPLPPFLLD